MPDEVLDAGAGDASANAEVSGASATASSDQGTNDDYSDLKSDARVQKYVSDLHSKALKGIPKEYREEAKFKELLQHAQQFQGLQGNPHFQAFMAGQQAGRGAQPPQQPQGKTWGEVLGALGKQYQFDDTRSKFFTEYGDTLSNHLLQQVEAKFFNPIRQHLAGQKVNSEYEEASKLPGFEEAKPKIAEIMKQYRNEISFHDAYKLAKYDDLSKAQEAAAKAAAAQAEEGENEQEVKLRRAKAGGDRPTGHGSGDVSLKKARTRGDAIGNAKRRLAAQGVNITE